MGENKALDAKLKAMEVRIDERLDRKSMKYSGIWSAIFSTIAFIVLSLSFGQHAIDASAEVIEATLASLEFIISIV